MDLDKDITQEEMEVFLLEADEQLQLLDEDFIALEKEGANVEILQEIFRAAHTLKGSSAMLGYQEMSDVAHAMETLLDQLRNGTLSVSTGVINALLYGLDALKSLRRELVSGGWGNVNVEMAVEELKKVVESGPQAAKTETDKGIVPEPAVLQQVRTAKDEGDNTYRVGIEMDPETDWAAVRGFQVLSEIANVGKVIWSDPSVEEIEAGRVGHKLELLVTSPHAAETIVECIGDIADIVKAEVNAWDGEGSTPVVDTVREEKRTTASSREEAKGSSQKLTQVSQTVRVDVKLLDGLMNLVGEMVIDRNRIGQIGKVLGVRYEGDETIKALEETSQHIMKVVNNLQDTILKVRMLPVGTVFNGFPRLVRDLAQKAGKKVEFIVEGQETELDRTIIEQIRDPLLHLLRNSVDHGIESPERRKAAGKAEEGTIFLLACHEQNQIVITVEDDGGGIDVERLRSAAVSKGQKSQEEAARMTDSEVINLIFASGVSTAERVTEVSGRGVGMDVVRTNIESLGGSVALESKLGQGSKFTIRLPLTLATISGLLVSSGDITYVIPMGSMVEVLELKKEEIETIMGRQVIRLRADILPLLSLRREFDQEGEGVEFSDGGVVAVIRTGEGAVGLAVDSVMEPQDTVVKSLGRYIGGVKGIAGATIMGDGRVALILDTSSLVREATAS